jgi:hypothetical protein
MLRVFFYSRARFHCFFFISVIIFNILDSVLKFSGKKSIALHLDEMDTDPSIIQAKRVRNPLISTVL